MPDDDPKELTSWKEIADRLQVTVRTAQEWEKKRGLPVRRVPGGRGRVYLRIAELEAWLDGQLEGGTEPGAPSSAAEASSPAHEQAVLEAPHRAAWPRVAIAATAVPLVLSLAWIAFPRDNPPALHRVVADQLIVADEDEVELWRVSFAEGLLEDHYGVHELQPVFHDLDDNGTVETLFVAAWADSARSHDLICYSEDGVELWRFTAGESVATATQTFANIFRIATLRVADLAPGVRGIVVPVIHYWDHPSQIVVLSPASGEVVSSYWHPGQIGINLLRLQVVDANGDGRAEIYASGVNNARAMATLIVLDPLDMGGVAREEDPEFQIVGPAPSGEIARVLFRRSELNRAGGSSYNVGDQVWVNERGVTVSVIEDTLAFPYQPTLLYRLGPDFAPDTVSPSDLFSARYQNLFGEGRIAHPIEEELEALGSIEQAGPIVLLKPAH